jgi:hypothetical protein
VLNHIEDEIERLVALLDDLDGDPDIEEDDPFETTLGDYSQDLELDTATWNRGSAVVPMKIRMTLATDWTIA